MEDSSDKFLANLAVLGFLLHLVCAGPCNGLMGEQELVLAHMGQADKHVLGSVEVSLNGTML